MSNSVAWLITAYHGTAESHLRAALDSIEGQTRQADEVVIVCDGPVSPQVAAVIDDLVAQNPRARSIRLPRNRGAGPASQAGLESITSTWTARLDSDDIAHPDRLEKQLAFLAQNPAVTVLGTAVEEFSRTPGDSDGTIRRLPSEHEQIARYAKINSPISNPSSIFHTESAREVGGYRQIHFMEDYDLWVRMLAGGAVFHNMDTPLTYFRVDDAQFDRRTGTVMLQADIAMQKTLMELNLISLPRAVFNLCIRTTYRLLPRRLLRAVYSMLFHRTRKG